MSWLKEFDYNFQIFYFPVLITGNIKYFNFIIFDNLNRKTMAGSFTKVVQKVCLSFNNT